MKKIIPSVFKEGLEKRQMIQEAGPGEGGITWRGVMVGALMCVLIAIGLPYGGMMIQGTRLGLSSATPAALFLLFCFLLSMHLIVGFVKRSWAFSRGELITIFSMMAVATAIPTRGVTGLLLPMITGLGYYATPENQWADYLQSLQTSWMLVNDQQAIHDFYEGSSSPIPWGSWLVPLGSWFVFYLGLYLTLVCLMIILRRQWVEYERLAFPMAQMPLAMITQDDAGKLLRPFFRQPVMWVGLSLPMLINFINALHHYDSSFPSISLQTNLTLFEHSLSIRIWVNFLILGFAYLINATISLSIWFFYFIHLLQDRVETLMGTGGLERSLGVWSEPGMGHQMMGALFILVCYGMWVGRYHLKTVLVRALGRGKVEDDADEILSYRGALIGFIIGVLIIGTWLFYSGIPALVVPFIILSSLVIFVGLARVVAEAGLPTITPGIIPAGLTLSCIGVPALGSIGVVATGYTLVWAGDLLVFMAAPLANILRLGTNTLQRHRRWLAAISMALLISLVLSVWFTLYLAYEYGAVNLHLQYFRTFAKHPAEFAMQHLKNPLGPDLMGWWRMGFGGLTMSVVMFMRQRFYWWPLHPLGFVTSMAWVLDTIWFSVFLAWFFKVMVLRYGGAKMYQKSKYWFMGLALGQIVSGGMWLVIDGLTGAVGHRIRVY